MTDAAFSPRVRLPQALSLRQPAGALAGICAAIWISAVGQAADTKPERVGATHGIAMHGAPALPPGFPQFPYVNPDAPKGGQLRLGALGSFDSLNPFIIKGVAPSGLREYVFESLMARSADEPFTLYGLIAEAIEVPADRSSITFHLRPEAHFSDGHPITAADVVFSHALLRDKGPPNLRTYYQKVVRVEMPDPTTVQFIFDSPGDREIPLILGLMPILPQHRLDPESFERTTLQPPIGSGPYVVASVDPGRRIVYRKDPKHWARDLPVYRGRNNFDEIRYDFFRDSSTLFEAFKAGQIDVRAEDDPARWAEGYTFRAVADGRVVLREFKTGLPAGMSALVLNTRRPALADQRVRRALIVMFDAEWINRSLYEGLYQRTESYFQRSMLASVGRPADDIERRLLAPFPNAVKPEVLEGRSVMPSGGGSTLRMRLREGVKLLGEAGYALHGEELIHTQSGAPLAFEFLAQTRAQERLILSFADALKKVGIRIRIRRADDAQYWRRIRTFDFDMTYFFWSASLSPGNEQINRWSSKAADTPYSLNFPGVKSAAADAMIDALLAAETREDFVSAVRALDRVLISGDYVIPLFHAPGQWIAHWRHLKMPEKTPLFGTDFDTWWVAK
jgi:peptide/nickel transport system substrate-binding protein